MDFLRHGSLKIEIGSETSVLLGGNVFVPASKSLWSWVSLVNESLVEFFHLQVLILGERELNNIVLLLLKLIEKPGPHSHLEIGFVSEFDFEHLKGEISVVDTELISQVVLTVTVGIELVHLTLGKCVNFLTFALDGWSTVVRLEHVHIDTQLFGDLVLEFSVGIMNTLISVGQFEHLESSSSLIRVLVDSIELIRSFLGKFFVVWVLHNLSSSHSITGWTTKAHLDQ